MTGPLNFVKKWTRIAMVSLAARLFREVGIVAQCPFNPYTSTLSPLLTLISWIYFLPLDWRKLLVDFCRIQAPLLQNQHLRKGLNELQTPIIDHIRDHDDSLVLLTKQDLATLCDRLSYSDLLCSFLAYFARAEGTVHKEAFLEEKDKSIEKEWQAAIYAPTTTGILNYSALFVRGSRVRLHPQLDGFIPTSLVNQWRNGINDIKRQFGRYPQAPLLPSYNSKKNISYASQREYYAYTESEDTEEHNLSYTITTLDLLRLYHRTGHQIGGPLEVRQSWFYNDLKPRTYYCLGGTDFFAGMYIQQIANAFCSILPSTNPSTRFEIARVGNVSDNQLLITYDYSSFTTSLSELRFFLFWLAESMHGIAVDVLDVVEGVRSLDLGDMLHEYNDLVNHYQGFSMERFSSWQDKMSYSQGRNGSLGVKGNIVFSTTLHGVSLADASGTVDSDLCVGDDALTVIYRHLFQLFVACVNNLGEINPSKFTTIPLPSEEELPEETRYKFLKRPLTVNHLGQVTLGILSMFPGIADALQPQGDGIHSAFPGGSFYNSARTFGMQWGRFLRIFYSHPEGVAVCDDDELEFVMSGIRAVYKWYGLPLAGGVPGQFRVIDRQSAEIRKGDFFLPPCDDLSVFREDWVTLLLFRYRGSTVTVPVTVGDTCPPPERVMEGQTFIASSDITALQLMEDLELMSSEVLIETRVWDETLYTEVLERMTGASSEESVVLRRYTVLEVPVWYYDSLLDCFTVPVPEDPEEALERISLASGM